MFPNLLTSTLKSLHLLPSQSFTRRNHLFNLFGAKLKKNKLQLHQHQHQHGEACNSSNPDHEVSCPIDASLIKPGIHNYHNDDVPDDIFMKSYNKLIEGNRAFVKEKTKLNPNYFKELSGSQQPNYFIISCSDSRVPPNELTKTNPGELFVHRNVANQVKRSDLNCQSALFYAVESLKVSHIIVLGHTHCGGITAAAKNQSLGVVDLWLQNVRDIAVSNKELLGKINNEHDFLDKLSELNVKHQALNVCKSAVVQKAWAEGRNLRVSGWMVDIESGYIKDLDVAQKDWEDIKKFFQFSFDTDVSHH